MTDNVTDIGRWSNPEKLLKQWDERAAVAAQFIPAGATVLDIGCGAMAVEKLLPTGCQYIPFDIVARDSRTLIGDLNASEFPAEEAEKSDFAVLLGVIEYIQDVPALLRNIRQSRSKIILTYHPTEFTQKIDRSSLGWINALGMNDLLGHLTRAGFQINLIERISEIEFIIKAAPVLAPAFRPKSVVVLSYGNVGNFGDRLGFHMLRSALPPEVNVKQAYFSPWVDLTSEPIDLLVLGAGNSIYRPMLTDDLQALVDHADKAIGIFGTQYRGSMPLDRLERVMQKLDTWYARYEEDANLYSKFTTSTIHLGDWLIDEFAMSVPSIDETLNIGREIWDRQHLDLTIKTIQSYKRVVSPRIHPLLCALTSAEEFQYMEQREFTPDEPSGKFRSMLFDIYGRSFPENAFCKNRRSHVIEYKKKVRGNIEEMRKQISHLLSSN